MKIEFAQEKSEYEVHLETIIIVLVVIASYCFTVQYIIRWVAYFILLKIFFFSLSGDIYHSAKRMAAVYVIQGNICDDAERDFGVPAAHGHIKYIYIYIYTLYFKFYVLFYLGIYFSALRIITTTSNK